MLKIDTDKRLVCRYQLYYPLTTLRRCPPVFYRAIDTLDPERSGEKDYGAGGRWRGRHVHPLALAREPCGSVLSINSNTNIVYYTSQGCNTYLQKNRFIFAFGRNTNENKGFELQIWNVCGTLFVG